MYVRRGYAHRNCFILCTDVTALHANNDAMSVEALHILYCYIVVNYSMSSTQLSQNNKNVTRNQDAKSSCVNLCSSLMNTES